MTDKEILNHKKVIDSMTHEELARLYRFTPSGHPYFDGFNNPELTAYFEITFKNKGGMTTEISKKIGW